MRRIRLKYFLSVIAVVILLTVGIHLVHRAQSKRIARALIGQADRAEKRGDRGTTVEYLQRYLSYQPSDAAAMVRLGKFLMAEGTTNPENARRVIGIFEKALILDGGLDEIRRQLAELDLAQGDFPAAQTHVEYLQNSRPDDGALELLRARCLEGLRKYQEAAEWYDKARKHQPNLIEAYVSLAGLKRRQLSRPQEADQVMDALVVKDGLIAANSKSGRAYLERARYRQEFKLPGFEKDIADAYELAPDDADVILAAALAARVGGMFDFDRARTLLRRGLKLHPKVSQLYTTLASLESADGKPGEAAKIMEQGITALRDQIDFRWSRADYLITAGNLDEAAKVIEKLGETTIIPESVSYLKARLLYQRRKWAEAARMLEGAAPVLAAREGGTLLAKRAYMLLGQAYQQLGKADQQFSAYRRAVDIVLPSGDLDLNARVGMASSWEARGRIDDAISEYRKIATTPGAPSGIKFDLARLLVLKDLRLPPAQRRWTEAEQAINDADKALPGFPQVVILRAEVLSAQGRNDEASDLIRQARTRTPDQASFWVAQAVMESRRGKDDEALRLINEAEARLGRIVELRSARARYWAGRGGPEGIAALGELERSAGELKSDEDRKRFLELLGDFYIIAGAPDRARQLVRQLVKDDPNNLPLRLIMFDQALVENDEASATKLLGEIERLDTEGVFGPYGRALLLIRRSELLMSRSEKFDGQQLIEARRLLSDAARIRPNWSKIPLAEARIEDLEKRPESALSSYLRAIDLGERGPLAILRASQLLSARGRYAQADQIIQKLQSGSALNDDQQRFAADLALRAQDFDRALRQAKAAVASGPKDYQNPLELGQVLSLMGRQASTQGRTSVADGLFKEAEEAFRNAIALDQNVTINHLSLVQLLVEAGHKDQAKVAMEKARPLLPPKEAPLALAQCLVLIGDTAGADEAYRRALAAAPADPVTLQAAATHHLSNNRPKESENLLDKLIKMEATAPSEAGWARRTKAMVMASGGNARLASDALNLLTPATASASSGTQGGPSTEGRRTKAIILSVQANRVRRSEAIGLLEEILREGNASTEDRFLLARLYESDGKWTKARELLLSLMNTETNNPRYGTYYILNLLQRNQAAEAQTWLARMEKTWPDQPTTFELKTRVLHALGRKTEALNVVSDYLRDNNAQALPFAGILEQIKEFDEAEKLFRRAANEGKKPDARRAVAEGKKPDANIALILFLSRRGPKEKKEAIDLCDAAWTPATAKTIANVYMRVLSSDPSPDQATMARIASRFEDQIKRRPDDIEMSLYLANLRTFQGKFAEAEAIYRSLIDRNKDNSTFLNNLAWLLACQEGHGSEALPLIQRAIEIRGEAPTVLDTRAITFMALGRADEAIRDMENAIVQSPVASKYFHLARAYRMAGRRDDAELALKKSKELGLTEAEVHPMERKSYDKLVADLAQR